MRLIVYGFRLALVNEFVQGQASVKVFP
jgi:hypothetical protein